MPIEIQNVKRYFPNKPRTIYGLQVEEDESYVVNGIISKNCRCLYIFTTSQDPHPPKVDWKPPRKSLLQKIAPHLVKQIPKEIPTREILKISLFPAMVMKREFPIVKEYYKKNNMKIPAGKIKDVDWIHDEFLKIKAK